MKGSLSRKISILVAVVLCLTLGISFGILVMNMSDWGMETAYTNIDEVNSLITKSLTFSMNEGATDVNPYFDMLKEIENLSDLKLMPNNNILDGSEEKFDEVEKEVFNTKQSQSFLEDFNDGTVIRTVNPVLAEESCLECHDGNKGDVLAVLSIRYSLENTLASIRSQQVLAIIMIVLTLVITFFIIKWLIDKNIIKSLLKLIKAILHLSRGDISNEIEIVGQYEIREAYESLSALGNNLKYKAQIAEKIAQQDLSVEIETKSEEDVLGFAMITMRDNLRTNREKLEEALNDSRIKAEYLSNLSFPVHVIDTDLKIKYINKAGAKLAGMSREECLDKKCFEILPNSNCKKEKCAIVRAMKEDKVITEETILQSEKKEIPFRLTGIPIKNSKGEIIGAMEQAYDITELKKLINDANQKVEYLNNLSFPVHVIDKEFTIQYINPAFTKTTGLTKDQSIGKKCYDLLRNSHCNTEMCATAKSMRENKTVTSETVLNIKGENVHVQYTGASVKNSNGEIVGALEQVIDISAIKKVVNEIYDTSSLLNEGDLGKRAKIGDAEGDYKKLIEGFNQTIDNLMRPVEEARNCLAEMASGNLTVKMEGEYKGDHIRMKEALNKTLHSLNEILYQVSDSVEKVAAGTHQVSDSSQAVSQGATEQASSLEETSASMTEINFQSKQNAENASKASELANKAWHSAEIGNKQMDQMIEAMGGINESSAQITKIIKVIDEIAFQTNLLALNAAVEAARAGVHGKGFAVVAEEVRSLAQRSAKAAKETTELIEDSVIKIKNGTQIVRATDQALKEIVENIEKVVNLAGEIANASKEQVTGIDQINTALAQIDQVTQANTASAEESASTAEELSGKSAELKNLLSKFQINYQNGDSIYNSPTEYAQNEGKIFGLLKGNSNKKIMDRSNYKKKSLQKVNVNNLNGKIILDDDEFGDF